MEAASEHHVLIAISCGVLTFGGGCHTVECFSAMHGARRDGLQRTARATEACPLTDSEKSPNSSGI